MNKITKKEFKSIYNKLRLIQGGIKNKSLHELSKAIDNIPPDFKTLPVTSIDTGSQGNHCITTIYRYVTKSLINTPALKNNVFYIVDTLLNNSKNKECSWNDKVNYSTVYKQQ